MVQPGLPFDPQAQARVMYWLGWPVAEISRLMEIPLSTVKSWKSRGGWDEASPVQRASECTYVQYMRKVMKPEYSPSDVRDIDLLQRQLVGFARIEKFKTPKGNLADLNPNIENRNKGPKKQVRPNLIDDGLAERLIEAFSTGLYRFQDNWKNTTSLRTRFILKSRQIGATFYFARERLIRALETGNDQIFISASRAQANVFRRYICDFVFRTVGVQLRGDPIVIDRGDDEDGNPRKPVSLLFLGTNYRTAQSYSGDVIIDECFWIHDFEEIFKVAGAMATHEKFTRTLFSTPSTIAHQAYPMWSGERFNKRRRKEERVKIDISHEALKDGVVGPDGVYRQIITVHDAIAQGFDLVNLDQLLLENSLDEFEQLFECNFIDDSKSCFPMGLLKPCMVDSWDAWSADFRPMARQPYLGEVWIGYDPNDNDGTGDPAGLVVLAAPRDSKSKFRVLETRKLIGLDYQGQANVIRDLKLKYPGVSEIAIDTKGCGSGVYQIVKQFFPRVKAIAYSVGVKGQMVLKAGNVLRNRRLEFDRGNQGIELAAALMSIHPKSTASGQYVTYVSRRTAETGHGDIGWALLNALSFEPLENTDGVTKKRSRVRVQK